MSLRTLRESMETKRAAQALTEDQTKQATTTSHTPTKQASPYTSHKLIMKEKEVGQEKQVRQAPRMELKRSEDLSITLSHIIPHLKNMQPIDIRKEVLRVGLELVTSNTCNPTTKRSIAAKFKNIVDLSDLNLTEGVINLALWLDRKPFEDNGQTENGNKAFRMSVQELQENHGKDGIAILDVLHYTYGLQYADLEVRNTNSETPKTFVDIFIGPNRKLLPYSFIRDFACKYRTRTKVFLDVPGKKGIAKRGKIHWINATFDQISVQVTDDSNTGQVFDSVYDACEWLKEEGEWT